VIAPTGKKLGLGRPRLDRPCARRFAVAAKAERLFQFAGDTWRTVIASPDDTEYRPVRPPETEHRRDSLPMARADLLDDCESL
jgi:hypothetical protein